jgi:hypothetical protein
MKIDDVADRSGQTKRDQLLHRVRPGELVLMPAPKNSTMSTYR